MVEKMSIEEKVKNLEADNRILMKENVLQRENLIVSIHSLKLEINGFGHNMMEVKNTNSS
jgi:hypothetical protein